MADYTPRMKTLFNEELIPRLMDELGLTNVMQVPAVREGRDQHGRG